MCVCQSLFQQNERVTSSQTPSRYLQKPPEKRPPCQVQYICESESLPSTICAWHPPRYFLPRMYYSRCADTHTRGIHPGAFSHICMCVRVSLKQCAHRILSDTFFHICAPPRLTGTGWRRPIGCLELQVIFRKRAIISQKSN